MDPAWNPLPMQLETLIVIPVAKRMQRTSTEPENPRGTQTYPSILVNRVVISRARDKATLPRRNHHSMLCSLLVDHFRSNTDRQWSNNCGHSRSTYPGNIRLALLSAIGVRQSP